MMGIAQALEGWNSKTVASLAARYSTQSGNRNLGGGLVELLAVEAVQRGASWLLKYHLEKGGEFSGSSQQELISYLPLLSYWEARLHILQSFQYLQFDAAYKADLKAFVDQNLTADRKFVRAWACDGLYRLAVQFPEYRREAIDVLTGATEPEAPSIRARVRKLLAAGFNDS